MRALLPMDPTRRAFSLVEILATVAILAIVAAVSIPMASRILENSKGVKLENDVADLNKAIKVYLASGGSLDGVTTAEAVLYKLKTQRSDAADGTYAGLRSSMVDKRLSVTNTSNSEASSGVARAVWDANEKRFVVSTSGGGGVREFVLDESLANVDFGSEERENSSISYTTDERGWIWNYDDTVVARPSGPTQITLVGSGSGGSGGSGGGSYGGGGDSEGGGGSGGVALALINGDADSSEGGIALATGGAESDSEGGIALGTNVTAIVVDEGVAVATPIISAELLTEDGLLSIGGGSSTASSGGSTATMGSEAGVEDATATGGIAGGVGLTGDGSGDGSLIGAGTSVTGDGTGSGSLLGAGVTGTGDGDGDGGLIGAGVSGTGDGSGDGDLLGAGVSGTGDATGDSDDGLGAAVSGTGDSDASGGSAIDATVVSTVYRLLGR